MPSPIGIGPNYYLRVPIPCDLQARLQGATISVPVDDRPGKILSGDPELPPDFGRVRYIEGDGRMKRSRFTEEQITGDRENTEDDRHYIRDDRQEQSS